MRFSSFEIVITARSSDELAVAIRWWRAATGRQLAGMTLRRDGAALRLACEPSAQQLDEWYKQGPRLLAKASKNPGALKSSRANAARRPAFA